MRPLRFGVTVSVAPSAEEWKAQARKAEALGFDVLTVAAHLVDIFPPFLPLLAAAEATTTLHVGTLVLNNDFRHPALVAREAATLDLLTSDRFELGIGAGHAKPEYESAGLLFDAVSVRVTRLGESVHVIKRLLAGESVSFAGEYYRLSEHRCFPVQTKRPPILVGGNGRKILHLAAREADIVGFTGLGKIFPDGQRAEPSGFPAARVDERVALVREAAGDRLALLELNALVQTVVVTDDRRAAAERVGASMGLTADEVLASPFVLIGTVDQMADDLLARRERWGISYYSIFGKFMDAFAPVLARLK